MPLLHEKYCIRIKETELCWWFRAQIKKNASEIAIKTGNCFKSGLGFDIIEGC
jgi:hypothetical protein